MTILSTGSRGVVAELWRGVHRYRGRTLAALGLLIVAKLVGVAVPLLLKMIIDRLGTPAAGAAPAPDAHLGLLLVALLLGYALLRFAGTLFTELRDLLFSRVAQQLVIGMSQRVFAHLLELSASFHAQRDTGSLIRDVERGTTGIGFLLGAGLFTIVPTLLEFFIVLAVLWVGYDQAFSLVVLLCFVVYAVYTSVLTERRMLRQRKVNEMDSRAHSHVLDTLMNYDAVKAYARERHEAKRYDEICARWIDTAVSNQRALSALHIGQSAIIAAGVAAVMLMAGDMAVGGRMTVGDLVLVNAYIIQICLPLNALGFVFREARDALVNIERLFELLEQRPKIREPADARPLQVAGGEIRFEHVDFGYEPGRQILFGISLALAPGTTVAVVGGSGSGKSTLARLLLRLHDVDGGAITIDGQDLRTLQLASLRGAISIVPQDTLLFNDTIAGNIGYGRLDATREQIVAAAQAAQVHELILSLPEQYETLVGERGVKLSGGEKQRVAIARAFLKNPPMMILDEATSALDTRAERQIQKELDRIAEGRTTLVIAHRLSTIVDADLIVVMDKGRIVERGRHEELLERKGLYAQLWQLQRQQLEVERLERRLARQPVNLVALIANAIDSLRPEMDARGIKLYSAIDIQQAGVLGDLRTLARVISDLLETVLHATPAGGRIELSLDRQGDAARLGIADGRHGDNGSNGPNGMNGLNGSNGVRPQVDPLEIRSLIERQGGRFETEPPGEGAGMRYTIALPLRQASAAPATAAPPTGTDQLPLAGLQIAQIDDSPQGGEELRRQLERLGARVQGFGSGAAALHWFDERPVAQWPQLLICDLRLGDEDGNEILRRIRRLEALRGVALARRIPALALSDTPERLLPQLSGFQAVFVKPVEAAQMLPTLLALLQRAVPR
ncbi:ABC transporter transmembrane domain-containing protein [Roseateles violae]|uniref:ABC transporter transmembrane domain-containing protein n=1 Tax=Roseateles violae TaxID=3058042 RepID=A0ABT8DY96_9BURK|nr:ABC transporter transmembrane domain-containing protein [Pelomonas sp. PFR6]MDN3922352.1 ABC transporter transmembrane domain-containing protein [Pelomonas sp. PFR6]